MPHDNIDLIAAINSYEAGSHGSDTDGGELSRQRALALDAYAGKNIEPAPEGRSQVVDWTVFETIQWILPSLTRIFAGGDDIVEFEPTGAEDEDTAQQESFYLNHLVTQKNNWFLICLTWFQDALLTKNAYCLTFMEEKLHPEIEKYEGISEDQVALLLEDDVEIVGQAQRVDEDAQGPMLDPITGEPIDNPLQVQLATAAYQADGQEPQFAPVIVFDLELKKVKAKKKLQFRVLPPERCKIGNDTVDFTLEDCNYFEYWDITTISELRKDGFEVDDEISDDGFTETQEDDARDNVIETELITDLPDPSMRQVVVRYVWIRYDYDDDGIAELQYVILVGNEVLLREELNTIPVSSIVPFLNTHRHIGNSIADLVFDIQRIKTSILRSGLDSLNLSVKPRHAISNKVNLDDLLTSRPGGVVRMREGALPGEGHILPLVTEFVFPQAQAGLQFMDTVTESRAGVSRQFQGIDPGANNDYDRIGQLSTMAAQRVEQIARIFANGVERLFKLAHELIVKSGHQQEAIRLRGEWVDIDPKQWKTGRDMRIVAPFAAGNKDSLMQRLMIIAQIHEKALASGAPFVQVDDTYALAKDLASAADLNGDRYFTDPSTVEPPPPGRDYTGDAIDVEAEKVKTEAVDEARQAELDKYKADLDARTKEQIARINSQTQIYLAQIKAGQQVDLEQVRANLRDAPIELGNNAILETSDAVRAVSDQIAESMQQIAAALEEVKTHTSADKEIIRDSSGKVTGIRSNGEVKPVKRNKAGRITGI